MHKRQILILNKIASAGIKRIPTDYYEVGSDIAEPEAILVRSADMHILPVSESLLAIGRAGVGTNNIPVQTMSQRGVVVFNTPGANANAVKELVILAILMAARNIAPALKFVEDLAGDDTVLSQLVEAGKKRFVGVELRGKVLGVFGLGAVGGIVANTALKLGMRVLGYDPDITVDAAWKLSSEIKRLNSLDELFKHSDFITLHTPLTEATLHLVNTQRVALLKNGAVIINFAREEIVDEQAVIDGLNSKKLRTYVCDFPSELMKSHSGVLALPHLGASTQEAEDNCAIMVVDQIREFLENGNISQSVNFPSVSMAREVMHRVSVASANIPNMLGQISTVMANAGLNIHDMVNKSRGDIAYTILDMDSMVPDSVLVEIQAIKGVYKVRNIPQKLILTP